MKVLKNNYQNTTNIQEETKKIEPYPRKLICENCGSELEYEESDLRVGWLGSVYLDCPLCGQDNMLDTNENCITLTMDNIEFPTHFHFTSTDTGAVDCYRNEEIKKCICQAIEYFRRNKDAFAWTTGYGNLSVHVYRYSGDEEYVVNVTNQYHEASIPFETEDYSMNEGDLYAKD